MKILIVDHNTPGLAVALNSALEDSGIALCYELPAGTEPPAELMMVPAGAIVTGRDGRSWNNPDPQKIVQFFRQRGLRVPLDIEHATELKAPKGEPAPAMAWATNFEARPDGSVWAAMDWGPKGKEMVANREYSYYSPAYAIDRKTMNIVGILSIGLTNKPNLSTPALNREHKEKGVSMELEQLLAALGLPAGTTFAAALNHINQVQTNLTTALNSAQNPPLDKFVPRADYDTALNRATTAEAGLKQVKDDQLEIAINAEIDAALKAGKITPATKDYHFACCRQEGGLERFKAFVAAAPAIAADSNLDGKDPGKTTAALNAEELKVCELTGLSVEEYKKANNL